MNDIQSTLLQDDDQMPKRPSNIGKVQVEYLPVRDILTRATGFMDAYDFTLNPYSGCSFGCTYCYAAFFSRSPSRRDNWGNWVKVKENALDQMYKHRGRLDGKLIYMSSVTDPYQPIERQLELTRSLLDFIARERARPKLVVQTRSPDVVRDKSVFQEIVSNGGKVQVNMTVTTDDEDLRKVFEPACPNNKARLRAMEALGHLDDVNTCITMTPLLLVRDVDQLVESLIATGVRKFIVQPFHFQRGKFVAGTRDSALNLMAEKLVANKKRFDRREYLQHYHEVVASLRAKLPQLGEGKEGFRPPF